VSIETKEENTPLPSADSTSFKSNNVTDEKIQEGFMSLSESFDAANSFLNEQPKTEEKKFFVNEVRELTDEEKTVELPVYSTPAIFANEVKPEAVTIHNFEPQDIVVEPPPIEVVTPDPEPIQQEMPPPIEQIPQPVTVPIAPEPVINEFVEQSIEMPLPQGSALSQQPVIPPIYNNETIDYPPANIAMTQAELSEYFGEEENPVSEQVEYIPPQPIIDNNEISMPQIDNTIPTTNATEEHSFNVNAMFSESMRSDSDQSTASEIHTAAPMAIFLNAGQQAETNSDLSMNNNFAQTEMVPIYMPNTTEAVEVNEQPISSSYKPPEAQYTSTTKSLVSFSLIGFYLLIAVGIIFAGYSFYQWRTEFQFSREEVKLAVGSTFQPEIISNGEFQDREDYEWASDNTSVATVSDSGLITAISLGETKITATHKRTNRSKSLLVTVEDIGIESIRFDHTAIRMQAGTSGLLLPIINDDPLIVVNLIWDSSNPNVVSVDENGRINALSEGTARITAVEEASGLAAELTVTVVAVPVPEQPRPQPQPRPPARPPSQPPPPPPPRPPTEIPVTGISFNVSHINLEVGEHRTINPVITPANATNRNVSWSSSNTSVASVANGRIDANGPGNATITARIGNISATVTVTVTVPPDPDPDPDDED